MTHVLLVLRCQVVMHLLVLQKMEITIILAMVIVLVMVQRGKTRYVFLIRILMGLMKAGISIPNKIVLEILTFGMLLVLLTVGLIDMVIPAKAAWLMQGSVATIGLPVLTLRGGGAASTSFRATCTPATPIYAPTVSRLAPSQNKDSIDLIHSTI